MVDNLNISELNLSEWLVEEDSESSGVDEIVVDVGPIMEEEIQAFLCRNLVTTSDLVAKFRPRIQTPQDRMAFANMAKKIVKIQNINGVRFLVLKSSHDIHESAPNPYESNSKFCFENSGVCRPTSSAVKDSRFSAQNESKGDVGPITDDEIRAILLQKPILTYDLVARFQGRLNTPEDKMIFTETLKRISKLQKFNGSHFFVLRET